MKKVTFFGAVDNFLHEAFGNEESRWYHIVNDILVVLILISIASIVLESEPAFAEKYARFFDVSEKIIVGLFTIEYIINIYVAQSKRKYIFGLWGFVDLVAILPTYLTFVDLRAVKVVRVGRILRFLRMMRLLKLSKKAAAQYKASQSAKINTLKMDLQIYFIALLSVLVIFSTLEYYAERGVEGTAFTSIPKAMWWCIVTITTVGYGDMYPVTAVGRIIAAATMLTGLALFGMLMNVIGKSMMSSLFGSADLETVDVQKTESATRKRSK